MKSLALLSVAVFAAVLTTYGAPKLDAGEIASKVASNIAARAAVTIGKENTLRSLANTNRAALIRSPLNRTAQIAAWKETALAALEEEEKTEAGRVKWHGRIVAQEINMDKETATFHHADGFSYVVKFQKPSLVEEVKKANAKLPRPPMTNGIPARLAAARLKRHAEKLTPTNIVIQTKVGNLPTIKKAAED